MITTESIQKAINTLRTLSRLNEEKKDFRTAWLYDQTIQKLEKEHEKLLPVERTAQATVKRILEA